MGSDIDSHKLMYHPERVNDWKKTDDCFPIYVEIELTNCCNHRCTFCGLDWARGKNIISSEIMYKLIDELADGGVKSVCFAGAGEPTLHKDLKGFLRKCHSQRIDSSISTNAVLFTKEIAEECMPYLSWIRFSVDAASSKTHALLHGTSESDFEKVKKNIQDAVEIKKKNNYPVVLGVQFLLLPENEKEVIEFVKIFKEIGVDNVQIKPYSQNPNSINKMNIDYQKFDYLEKELAGLSSEKFSVIYRGNRMSQLSHEQDYCECYGLPFFSIITSEGNVMPCHLYFGKEYYSYGNINTKTFKEIWRSARRKEIVEEIKKMGVSHCKKGCRLDSINKYLYRIKNPLPHDNFI
ncbi:MAG: radical SAM protein [Candidatus Nanoarchaeia archaeon]|nr:radical SAM protein [Candidatus Nanoarchaeia archaeon]MDD5358116.1 radical SAM protein [Candidatus Nanoarchaeia archaeon]MDD5589303.1 radical SAM protein [Candidatus Nanoarchaeia archaeon]